MKTLTVQATPDRLAQVTDFIDGQLEAVSFPMKGQTQINVAIDELFSNIARCAYGDETGDVTVGFDYDPAGGEARITFMDRGVPFNPLTHETPDVTLPPEERAVGGLGIFLVRKLMNRMEYRREDGQNILTIAKSV